MAIIVNTNMSALKTQRNLTNATSGLNRALERMSTGYKINSAKDDAAGMFIASKMATQLSGMKIAKTNIQTGQNLLDTTEGVLNAIESNVNRIRDLAVQASNGIYDSTSRQAMQSEIDARIEEIARLQDSAQFNGLSLFGGSDPDLSTKGLRIQVGANNGAEDSITIPGGNFTRLDDLVAKVEENSTIEVEGAEQTFGGVTAAGYAIAACDTMLKEINTRKSTLGAVGARLDSASEAVTTSVENLTAAHSTIMDADIAEESAEFTKQQILQQTSAALLSQANQLPSIALSLIQR